MLKARHHVGALLGAPYDVKALHHVEVLLGAPYDVKGDTSCGGSVGGNI